MKTEGLSIEVRLPASGDKEFEALIENITDAVYERIKRRLQEDAESLIGPLLDLIDERRLKALADQQRLHARDI